MPTHYYVIVEKRIRYSEILLKFEFSRYWYVSGTFEFHIRNQNQKLHLLSTINHGEPQFDRVVHFWTAAITVNHRDSYIKQCVITWVIVHFVYFCIQPTQSYVFLSYDFTLFWMTHKSLWRHHNDSYLTSWHRVNSQLSSHFFSRPHRAHPRKKEVNRLILN